MSALGGNGRGGGGGTERAEVAPNTDNTASAPQPNKVSFEKGQALGPRGICSCIWRSRVRLQMLVGRRL